MANSSCIECRLFWLFDIHYFHAIYECRNDRFNSSYYIGDLEVSISLRDFSALMAHIPHYQESFNNQWSEKDLSLIPEQGSLSSGRQLFCRYIVWILITGNDSPRSAYISNVLCVSRGVRISRGTSFVSNDSYEWEKLYYFSAPLDLFSVHVITSLYSFLDSLTIYSNVSQEIRRDLESREWSDLPSSLSFWIMHIPRTVDHLFRSQNSTLEEPLSPAYNMCEHP